MVIVSDSPGASVLGSVETVTPCKLVVAPVTAKERPQGAELWMTMVVSRAVLHGRESVLIIEPGIASAEICAGMTVVHQFTVSAVLPPTPTPVKKNWIEPQYCPASPAWATNCKWTTVSPP